MLNGHFENCYGLKRFNLPNINFSRCNKALIYAPNGVMKSSLSKVFDNISKGLATREKIDSFYEKTEIIQIKNLEEVDE